MSLIDSARLARAYAHDATADERRAAEGTSRDTSGAPDRSPAAAPAPDDTAGSAGTAANLHQLAAAVGVDPDVLLERIAAGEKLADLAGRVGQTGYGSSAGPSVTGGIVLDVYA